VTEKRSPENSVDGVQVFWIIGIGTFLKFFLVDERVCQKLKK